MTKSPRTDASATNHLISTHGDENSTEFELSSTEAEGTRADSSKLTDETYWNQFWKRSERANAPKAAPVQWKGRLKRIIGESRLQYFTRSYADFVIWERLYPRHLASVKGAKVLEVGCAPGNFLVRLHRAFGCEPFGVEYARDGFELTKQTFSINGLNPANVAFADAFSEQYQRQFSGFFDAVFSRGVIEHFSDVGPIVNNHVALLKPGGRLIVSIPNYRGCNFVFKRILGPKSLKAHNLELMRKTVFREAFALQALQQVFCDYYGTCDLSMSVPEDSSKFKRIVFQVLDKSQLILNGLSRFTLRGAPFESAALSPSLLYVGIRLDPSRSR
jgi:2-polyprenyl-3-methyl-5-hydroxy-6-metoxy-1,4-benzoquinol methylase